VEGFDNEVWVVVDTGNIMVSIMKPEVREYYNLEALWLGYERYKDLAEEAQHWNDIRNNVET
tara:strand:- start:504 stop:689 length:186 start_codon:yes stop_codon:yes gene_type:complete